MRRTIEECRARFGEAPRRFGLRERLRLNAPPPKWMKSVRKDGLWSAFRNRGRLLREGRVVWGSLVMCNDAMFGLGEGDSPGLAVYSFDEYFDDTLGELLALGTRVYELREEREMEADTRDLARGIANDVWRPQGVRLPASLSGGREALLSAFLPQRAHLPDAFMAERFFPLVAHRECEGVVVLPWWYWPDTLISSWRP